jgi:uncharacterized membrane-anchored protein YhcB (DUF1043 family)
MILGGIIGLVVGFVVGILVGRRNRNSVEVSVEEAKKVLNKAGIKV